MDLGITGRRVLVTGGAGGLGVAAARQLLEEGARVVLTDTDADDLADAAGALDGVEDTIVADLTDGDEVAALGDRLDDLGGCDVLVHMAGVTGAKGDPLDMADEDWEHAWQIDFMSAVRLARRLVPTMVEGGWGRVVFVTSENAVQPYTDEAVYNAAKAALLNFTKCLAQAYAPRGVLVNAVSPAFVETPMTDQMMEQRAEERGTDLDEAVGSFLDEERPWLVLGRRGRPEEVAAVVALLCSERASFTVGSNYRVDGGSVATMDV